jgi:hypothetical protein
MDIGRPAGGGGEVSFVTTPASDSNEQQSSQINTISPGEGGNMPATYAEEAACKISKSTTLKTDHPYEPEVVTDPPPTPAHHNHHHTVRF